MATADIAFWIFAFIAVASAFLVAVTPNPLFATVSLLGGLFAVAGLFAFAGAHFLAAMQVLVYAGAITVLFLFVIMLLNLTPRELGRTDVNAPQWLGLAMVVVATIGISAVAFNTKAAFPTGVAGSGPGATAEIGRALLLKYAAAFEVVSLLLLAAMGGAVMVVKRDQPGATISTIQQIRAQIDARAGRAFVPDPAQPDQQGPPLRQQPKAGPRTGVDLDLEPGDTV